MQVSDAMHTDVYWVPAETAVSEIAKIMLEQDIGAVPGGENDRLIGMVTDRDIALRIWENDIDPAAKTARHVMTEGIIYCRTNETVEDAIRLMEQKKIRRLPVLNDDRGGEWPQRSVGGLRGPPCLGGPRRSLTVVVSEYDPLRR